MTGSTTVRAIVELRDCVGAWRAAGERIALVPTMGALHKGHLSLLARARENSDRVVVSLFVNPAQFSPSEDFASYPRDEAADLARLAAAGCDLLYAPPTAAMYPPGFSTFIQVGGVSEDLEGAARPGHFAGVATVVAKLLIQVAPDIAVFGEKDYQQLLVIGRLVSDLDLAVEILSSPTVRADDGLALSSRNARLTPPQRAVAPAMYGALLRAADDIRGGTSVAEVEERGAKALASAGFHPIDYFVVRAARDLAAVDSGPVMAKARVLAAARLGSTRLIDSVAV